MVVSAVEDAYRVANLFTIRSDRRRRRLMRLDDDGGGGASLSNAHCWRQERERESLLQLHRQIGPSSVAPSARQPSAIHLREGPLQARPPVQY